MLEKTKLEKIKTINNDYSDLVLKFDEYIEREISFCAENVYSNIELINDTIKNNKECLYIFFSNELIEEDNLYKVKNIFNAETIIDDNLFYFGKRYDKKLESFSIEKELLEKSQKYKSIKFVFDINEINSFPLWETKMHRKIVRVLEDINKILIEELNTKKLKEIINNTKLKEIKSEGKYDIDFIIKHVIELSKEKETGSIFICKSLDNRNKFLVESLSKLVFASTLQEKERNEYIYDTTYKDMNEMFSKFGFCNFKGNKCVSQRHKSITNRYPVPKTDGCCFKVINKCKHNNKDGTCKVECLPCKLFTCMYLSGLGVGLRVGELILMRAFLTQKQRRLLIYKFYQPKEYFLKRM